MIEIYRGDTLELLCNIADNENSPINLSDYEIRAELCGNGMSIKKANAKVIGGSDEEISIIDIGKIKILFDKTETAQLEPNKTYDIEVEITSPEGKRMTVIRDKVLVKPDIIDWESK